MAKVKEKIDENTLGEISKKIYAEAKKTNTDPYKVKGEIKDVKGVQVCECGFKQEDGPEYTSLDELIEAGYTGFMKRNKLVKYLSQDDFDGEAEVKELEADLKKFNLPDIIGMSLEELKEITAKEDIDVFIGAPSLEYITNRVYYDTIYIRNKELDAICIYQTYLDNNEIGSAMNLRPLTLSDVMDVIS